MKNLTYVFAGNRKEKYFTNSFEAKDFFYGLTFFEKEEFNIEIIEPSSSNSNLKKILLILDLFFKKILSLPVYTYQFISFKNLRLLMKTDKLILINETTYASLAFLILLLKVFKRVDVYVFIMGLYSKKLKFPKLKFFHFLTIKLFSLGVNKFLFLGKGEFNKACLIHPTLKSKFKYFPFYIDTKFWKNQKINNLDLRNQILFVGNDGNRDYDLFLKVVKELKNYNFAAVTKIPEIINANEKNLKILYGSNQDGTLTDIELKKVYNDSKLVVLPLKNTTQPSGQSVALQAMANHRAVIISDTDGFWDNDVFIDGLHLKKVYVNNLVGWKDAITELYNDINQIKSIEVEGNRLVLENFNLNTFEKKLKELIYD